ncbi:MAG: chemotaxis protein CheB [Litorimonas sp.]
MLKQPQILDIDAPRVLVVEDSVSMRTLICRALEADGMRVVGAVATAYDAEAIFDEARPDAVTLDIEIPGMNGLDYLDVIMARRPLPVVMFSTLTSKGAAKSIEALAAGAFTCIGKPTAKTRSAVLAELVSTVRAAVASSCVPGGQARKVLQSIDKSKPVEAPVFRRLVTIGAETGGVEALIRILADFPEHCPPTLVAQKLEPTFLKALVAKLDTAMRPTVKIAEAGETPRSGHVYFSPADHRHLVLCGDRLAFDDAGDSAAQHGVDALFSSVATSVGARSVGVQLTGKGTDGAAGLLALKKSGAVTLGQSEDTCAVYQMPQAAKFSGAVDREVPLPRIAKALLRAATQPAQAKPVPVVELDVRTPVSVVGPEPQPEALSPGLSLAEQFSPALRAIR